MAGSERPRRAGSAPQRQGVGVAVRRDTDPYRRNRHYHNAGLALGYSIAIQLARRLRVMWEWESVDYEASGLMTQLGLGGEVEKAQPTRYLRLGQEFR